MLCAISGAVPEEPVVSKVSGRLYEKRLVLKIIQERGRDPVSDEPLSEDDLLPVVVGRTSHPRPVPASSIPGLLTLFQNEWDAAALELHTLRSSLHRTRQELAHALYQHDAATRVIARLTRERDAARAAAETAAVAAGGAAAAAQEAAANGKRAGEADAGDADGAKRAKSGFTPDVVAVLVSTSAELSKGRRKRVLPETLAPPEALSGLTAEHAFPVHRTRKGGITSLDLAPGAPDLAASAGADGTVQLYDVAAARSVAELSGHGKRVNGVAFLGGPRALASAGADGTVRLWRAAGSDEAAGDASYEQAAAMPATAEVVSVDVHPSGQYLVSAATDGTWALHDAAQGLTLATVSDPGAEFSTAALHPDGVILATGTDSAAIKVWDLRSQAPVTVFEGHQGRISSLAFSENGYHMASAAADGVRFWDLRKLKTLHTLAPFGEGVGCAAVTFDHSGMYLAAGGPEVKIFGVKQDFDELTTLGGFPKKGVLALKFGTDARKLLVGASDHNLRVFSL